LQDTVSFIGLFDKKETYDFKEPTNCIHSKRALYNPIMIWVIGLFGGVIGLFCGYTGLFCCYVGTLHNSHPPYVTAKEPCITAKEPYNSLYNHIMV